MGRPVEFEREDVLYKALLTFRHKGFTNTSIKDLESATGLKPGSIYSAFGNKRDFFVATLHSYFELTAQHFAEDMAAEPTPLAGLKRFYERILSNVVSETPERCCYVVKTALELSGEEPDIQIMIRDYFTVVERNIIAAIRQGQELGEVTRRHSAETLGKLLLTWLYGINVESMINPQLSDLELMKETLFTMLSVRH